MLLSRINGWSNGILRFMLMDSSSTTGGAKVGLSGSSSGLVIATLADGEASSTNYSASASTIDTIATLGTYAAPTSGHCRLAQIDSTNMPGLYELQLPNSRFAVANAGYLIVEIQAPGSNVSPQAFIVDLDTQADTRAFGGIAGSFSGGIPAVNTTQIAGVTSRATKLGLEMDGRVTGTVTTATFTPTTTSFECSDITDSASFAVYINRGFLVTAGGLIKYAGVILGDLVGTSGRRFITTALPQALASADTLLIL